MKLNKRDRILEQIKPFVDKQLIKVLLGQRRSGKSCILRLIAECIKDGIPSAKILYINKELYEYDSIKDYRDLIEYVDKENQENEFVYLFIDEIQDIEFFEKALRHFNANDNYDIYCTGSNAKLLSSEFATVLSGRYVEFYISPLSFAEFSEFNSCATDDKALSLYLRYGSMPYLNNLDFDDEIIYSYLGSVYNSIVLKDIVNRYALRNVDFLERLILFCADNIGSLFSAKKISDYLKAQRVNISPTVVLNYLSYLNSVFFISSVRRYDIKGKRIFDIGEKLYFTDIGIRNSLVGYKADDIGKLMENLVFCHLKSQGYNVYVGKLGDKEIDFVAIKQDMKIYVQVAYLLVDENTVKREFGNLLAIDDNYEKIVVSMDPVPLGDYQGIRHLHLRDFLLSSLS